ncbi:glycoside hydrolase family 13 protein [Glaciibacter psychrotolerans]|uniref:Alpha-glucosidase n=1 Tax=Glaciibacter psychrotolerans TaxID=670054 RepID=A0A7Z0J6Y9_9MICO|nr:glycoside hydrolase family 13 protein [Leifsonia psychrotolerans]NYJ20706.1 alpha-glucosidase [Leifsonia psychrotolerans]
MLQPHHDGSPLYVSTQEPSLGDVVQVRLRIPHEWGTVAWVRTRSNPNREPRYSEASVIASSDGWDWWEAAVTVENPVHGYRFAIERTDGTRWWLNAAGLHEIETLDAADFTLLATPAAPAWAASSVLYQIFPDRFGRSPAAETREQPGWAIAADWDDPVELEPPGRSQQFYGGDLDGIAAHFDHLQRLGVTLIYLTPVFPGGSNHRYDASSFDEVDPLLGGNAAFARLIDAAHARGFKVIGDLTSNHSGDRHEWFQAAHRHPDAPESDFYYWRDTENEGYESWLGVPSLPKFNWNSTELRRRFIDGPDSVVARWLKAPYGLDGWRIDVANMTGRLGAEDLNAQVRQTILTTMRDVNPDTILLGESTNDAASDFQGDAWHGAMTYAPFTRPLWSWLSEPGSPAGGGIGFADNSVPEYTGRQFFDAHQRFVAGFPWRIRLATMNALDTHDTPRFRTSARPGTVPVALGLSVTLPGIPVIFAGDEFGLVGIDGEQSRTPIPWETAAEPAVSETIELYARVIGLRTGETDSHAALNGGGLRWLHVGEEILVFVRESSEGSVLVLAARSAAEVTLPARALAGAAEANLLIGEGSLRVAADGIRLAARGACFTAWSLRGLQLPQFGAGSA